VRSIPLPTARLAALVDDEGVGWLVFDDPATHNALSAEMLAALPLACEALAADDAVRVVVLRGGGDRAFVSGGNLAEMHARAEAGERPPARADRLFAGIGAEHLLAVEKPVVAMLRGFCIGGGLLLALCADLRIAADDAQVGIPAARLGVAYPHEAVSMLAHLAGPAVAAELLLTGARFPAEDALRMGIVQRVVTAASLEDETRALAAMVAANAPLSLRATKASLRAVAGRLPVDDARARIEEAWASADAAEGPRAFAQKRPPRFEGR
jgi:enoyl-CoA hydratase